MRAPEGLSDARGASGTLRVSVLGDRPTDARGRVHQSVFVPGREYRGFSDNDIRGYVDGGFVHAWNQESQTHVRVGRFGDHARPEHGEQEVFRLLQRWDAIDLGEHVELERCELALRVERGCDHALTVVLYPLMRRWNPGSGGRGGNNVSVPEPGDVWWRDARHGEESWGLPGAGFASDGPGADIPTRPLATASYAPGDEGVRFASAALTRYAEGRLRAGSPLLFLIKLADLDEDVPGAVIHFYSGEFGDGRTLVRRPMLILDWRSPCELSHVEESVQLEHGRSFALGPVDARGGRVVVSFACDAGHATPLLETRQCEGEWQAWGGQPLPPLTGGVAIRVRALTDPVPLGAAFEAGLRDTWVVSGPPEEQEVRWRFTSPTGVLHDRPGEYLGDFRWTVSFVPDEVGPWTYTWSHELTYGRTESAPGRFDVVVESVDAAVRALDALVGQVSEGVRSDERARLETRMARLARGAMALLTPETIDGPEAGRLRTKLRELRSGLWGRSVPSEPPLESFPLVRTVDGRTVRDPFPDWKPARARPAGSQSLFSRLRRKLKRAFAPRSTDTR